MTEPTYNLDQNMSDLRQIVALGKNKLSIPN